jgi:hypothetical protein
MDLPASNEPARRIERAFIDWRYYKHILYKNQAYFQHIIVKNEKKKAY